MIAGATLSRFFALHVFVIPGSLIAFVGLHLLLVLKLGINEWPMPGRVVRRATYLSEYHELTCKDGVPFVPGAVAKDLFFSGFILLSIAACALYFGPFGPSGQPDPTIIQTAPRPDYFFLWLYAVLSLLPPSMETPALLIGPVIALVVLVSLPFFSGEGEKSWRRRPIAVLTTLLVAVALGTFTHLAGHAPWSPAMDAWSGEPIPAPYLKGRTALERQGALIFQAKQCHNCHELGGVGGKRGPELDRVAVQLTQDQLIRQVIQGGGNMPAYGNNLNPAETTALVAFLETLYPAGQTPMLHARPECNRDAGAGCIHRNILTWLVSALEDPAQPDFGLAVHRICRGNGLARVGYWVSTCRVGRTTVDSPYGATSSANDRGCAPCSSWRALDHPTPRATQEFRPRCAGAAPASASRPPSWGHLRAPGFLLACGQSRRDRLARPRCV